MISHTLKTYVHLAILPLFIISPITSALAAPTNPAVCNFALTEVNGAWTRSSQTLQEINKRVYGRTQVIEAMTTAILAREFVWMNGEPGGAKTFLSRMMFQAVLNSISDQDKKIFLLQFHKLINEGKITGFQKFKSMMEDGKYEIENSTSLVGNQYLFLIADEAEKSNAAVLNALLAVLAERKAFLGSRVVDAILASGVFTSNKTTGEFIQGFFSDRPSGEALLDRMAIKIHIPNQQVDAKSTLEMYDMVKNPTKGEKLVLPLYELDQVLKQVQVSDEMMRRIVRITRDLDQYVTTVADKSRTEVRYGERESEYFPANQFSNRSVRKMVQVFKAAFLSRQLMNGTPIDQLRLVASERDLDLLATSALYIGAGQIHPKRYLITEEATRVLVNSPYGTKSHLDAYLSPYENRLYLVDQAGNLAITLNTTDNRFDVIENTPSFSGWTVDAQAKTGLSDLAKNGIETQKINVNQIQFEVDSNVEKFLAKGTVKSRTAGELRAIKADLDQLVTILNQNVEVAVEYKPATQTITPARTNKEHRAFLRSADKLQGLDRAKTYYGWMTTEVKAIRERFIEMDHLIEADLTAMLSKNHLYVFGPPGGAKTASAEIILKAELKNANHNDVYQFVQKVLGNEKLKKDQSFLRLALQKMRTDSPKDYDRFLLQFHKLIPEGVLVGFPKVDKMLNEGIEEIETSSSLASMRFIFAILDEVDKANPQTIAALLSILQEGEVFAGNQVIKVGLQTAIMTSNKMPSEFLDSYYEDRSTGEAIMDRAVNKVFVSNKISDENALTQFLVNLEKGISPKWNGLLGIGELAPVVKQVDFSTPMVKELFVTIHQKFLAKRIQVEEESWAAHKADAREFPDYYVSAAGNASDRTLIKLLDQVKSRLIVHQLMQGVPFEQLRTSLDVADIALFFEGMGYWAPQSITTSFADDGILQLAADSHIIETLINSGVVDARSKYHLQMMTDEAKDFANIASSTIREFLTQYRAEIENYPHLFPGAYKEKPAN